MPKGIKNETIPIIGKKFGRWIVLEKTEERTGRHRLYKCKCDCGEEGLVPSRRLRSGESLSCGCLTIECTKKSNTTHGLSKHPLYAMWLNVRKRCYDEKIKQFKDYGGRGIKMHEEWRQDSIKFINWCSANGWKPGLSIDRIDNNGDYEPDNVRFVTHKEQQRNTGKNRFIAIDGETKCLSEWCEIYGVRYSAIFSRIKRGWEAQKAITTPIKAI